MNLVEKKILSTQQKKKPFAPAEGVRKSGDVEESPHFAFEVSAIATLIVRLVQVRTFFL